jgi:hypothetical protein
MPVRNLTGWWLWLHLASIAALVWQPSQPTVILGRYSRNAALLVLLLALAIPVVMWAARALPRWPSPPLRVGWALVAIGALFVGVMWGLPAASAVAYKVARIYLTFVVFTVSAWATTRDTLRTGLKPAYVRLFAPALTLLTLILVVSVAGRFPGVLWTDEGYMVSTALGFNRTGSPVPLMWQPYDSASFSLSYLGMGLWLRLFGVGHVTARLFTLAIGLAMLGVMWLTVRGAYSRFAAWGAVIAGAFAVIYLNVLRQDMLAALYLSVGLLLYGVATRRQVAWLHLLVGFFIGFSIDGHQLAFRLGVGFGLAYAVEYATRLLRDRQWINAPFYWLAAGGVAGAGAYFALYGALTTQMDEFAGGSYIVPAFDLGNLSEQLALSLQNIPVLFGLGIMGAVVAIRRNTPLDRLLLIVGGVSLLVPMTLYPVFRWYYLAHTLPILMLFAAGLLASLPDQAALRNIAVLLITAAGAGYLLRGVILNSQDYSPAHAVAREMRAVIPAGTTFTGVDPFYVVMPDYPFFEQQVITLLAASEGVSAADAWEIVAPDAVALVSDYPLPTPAGIMAYIDRHDMVRAYCWQVAPLGTVDLYMHDREPLPFGECTPLSEDSP